MIFVIFLVLMMLLPVLAATAVEHSVLGRSTPVGKAVDRISAAAPPLLPLVFWYALGQETYKALPPVRKRAALTARRECVTSTAELTKWLQRNSTQDLQVFGIERGIRDHFRAVREGSLDTVDHNALKQAEDAAREADPILAETKDRLPMLRLFSDCRWCTWSNDRLWVDKEIVTTGSRRTHICPDHGGEVKEFVERRDCPDCNFVPRGGNNYRRAPCWRHGGSPRPVSKEVAQLAREVMQTGPKAPSEPSGAGGKTSTTPGSAGTNADDVVVEFNPGVVELNPDIVWALWIQGKGNRPLARAYRPLLRRL